MKRLLVMLLLLPSVMAAEDFLPAEAAKGRWSLTVMITSLAAEQTDMIILRAPEGRGDVVKSFLGSHPSADKIVVTNVPQEVLTSVFLETRALILSTREELDLRSTEEPDFPDNATLGSVMLMLGRAGGTTLTVSIGAERRSIGRFESIRQFADRLKKRLTALQPATFPEAQGNAGSAEIPSGPNFPPGSEQAPALPPADLEPGGNQAPGESAPEP